MGNFNPLNIIDVISNLLGEKDTYSETNERLAELDYPHIRDLLPFKFYDFDHDICINNNSVGFTLEAQPLIGANEGIVEGLSRILQNNVPREQPIQVTFLGSQAIQERLEEGLKDFSWKGEMAEECNTITRNYYLAGAEETIRNKANQPLTLRDYRLYFTYALPTKHFDEKVLMRVKETKRSLISSLNSNNIYCETSSIQSLVSMFRELINFQYGRLRQYSTEYSPEREVAQQVVNPSTRYLVKPSYILITSQDERGKEYKTRSVGFHLDHNPSEHYLWQNGNIISDLLNPDRGIMCPFILTMIINTEEQEKSKAEANRKFLDLDKKVNSSFAKFIPSTVKEYEEWKTIRQDLMSGNGSISNYFIGLRLFCADNDDEMMREQERVIKAFENQGLALVRSDFMQIRDFLASVPYCVSDNPALWGDFKRSGAILRAQTFQATNLLPIIGDNKLSSAGIVLPSYRNQLAFLDVFDESLPNTNFNWFESGTSGAGKSFFAQAIARQVLDRNGLLSIFDIGDSYKAFCQSMGGTYINGSSLRFNPFANVRDISNINLRETEDSSTTAERIRDQLCILASPNGNLDEVHQALILKAIVEEFPKYQQDMRIDHVIDYLKKYRGDIESSERISGRIDEITHLLEKYSTKGVYGKFFNSSEPTLRRDMQFVVTELGDLRKAGDLLMGVLFTLMLWVEDMMYSTPRNVRKMNIIDEGWKLLGGSSAKIREFIEEGYRTVRRHGGSYGTVTQSIGDKNLSTAALAAYDNSSFKFTMMQDAKAFEALRTKEPTLFSEFEYDLIKKFPPAKNVGYSSVLVNVGAYSSFHRVISDPLTTALFSSKGSDFDYRERRFKEGASITEIISEMANRDEPEFMRYLQSKRY